jgi:hypothetical protein
MANYYATSRTNYVEVTDAEAFKKMAECNSLQVLTDGDKFGLAPNDFSGDGCWPSEFTQTQCTDDEDNVLEPVEFDFRKHVMPLVKEGQVLVVMQAGAEKLRYISGSATAFVRRGDDVSAVHLSLYDIYAKAAEVFGISEDDIIAAEY